MSTTGVSVPDVLLPNREISLHTWAVVACDQYTSQPSYWAEVDRLVGSAPSTLRLIFPEVFLGDDDSSRIQSIQAAMRDYVERGVLVSRRGLILVERSTQGPHGPHTRRGLMACIDLEHYDYTKGSTSLVRATEGTILERLPPRIRIREGAPLELPHVMLLIDDPGRTVIEPLAADTSSREKVYDTDLMQEGGHIRGYGLSAEEEARTLAALAALAEPEGFRARYQLQAETPVLLFAVGDGNHSLATAKAVWERAKQAGAGPTHPARFALAEIVNVHDEGLTFEPIHRVLFQQHKSFVEFVAARLGDAVSFRACSFEEAQAHVGGGDTHRVALCWKDGAGLLTFSRPAQQLPVATLQPLLDAFMSEGGAHSIDYVHGTEALSELGTQAGNLGLSLPPMDKGDLFKTVILDGALPRKTFSMGEANEKRFYLECRRITE
jgi:hypothetical protein